MRVLAIGDTTQRERYFPSDAEYTDVGPFDAALLASTLQTIPRTQVQIALSNLYEELVDGGRIIVTVPALDWACRDIVTQNDISLGAYMSIYGTEGQPHLSGFTMLWLRRCLEEVGFIVVEAHTEQFKMQFTMGAVKKEEKAKQHVIIGVKHQVDAAAALDWLAVSVPEYLP